MGDAETFTNVELVAASERLMKAGRLRDNTELVAVLNEARMSRAARRRVDDGTLVTVAELRAAARRAMDETPSTAEWELYPEDVDPLVRDIIRFRDPEYITGRTYRDAGGRYFRATGVPALPWESFQSTLYHDDNTPARPLELMP